MHNLEMPFAHAGIGVETHQRLAEEIITGATPTVEIVGRRADGQINQAAFFIQAHRRPDVRVTGELPRIIAPGVVAELTSLRNSMEAPHALSGARVEGAHVAGRIVLVCQPVADAVAD